MVQHAPSRETFDWLKPSPLWAPDGADATGGDLFRPRLLRFDSDQFMDDFLAAAADASSNPLAARVSAVAPEPPRTLARLFQPAHGSFYLVCASLCCRRPGFPDRELRTADEEQAFFVLRKHINKTEFGWVAAGPARGWKQVPAAGDGLVPGEERLPLIAAAAGNGRSLFLGYVPVSSRETYAAGKAEFLDADAVKTDAGKDPRVQELGSRFTGAFIPPARNKADNGWTGEPLLELVKSSASRITSIYLLLDLWDFFDTHLKSVAAALLEDPARTLPGDRGQLMALLRARKLGGTLTLAAALHEVAKSRADLNDPVKGEPLAASFGVEFDLRALVLREKSNDGSSHTPYTALRDFSAALNDAVARALPQPDEPLSFDLPKVSAGDVYALRLVYERPQCVPPRVFVSRRTDPFELAGVYDADAPARQVRIPLPGDVSVAGLRKMKKNVSFLMSDAMRKKMGTLTGCEEAVLDGKDPCPEPGGDFAFICSFSFQIIFIIAFMLLLIFVIVFNIIFFWIAFFKICFPIPKSLAPK